MRQKNMKRHVLNTGYGLFLLILAFPLWACSYEEGRSYYRAKQYEKAHACFMQPENRQNPKAWNTLGIMYNNGFLGSAQRIFNPNSYNYVVVENLGLSRDVWKSVSNFINLYKIHGSINWLKDDNSGSDTPHILEKDIELIRSRKKYDSIMIYPTPQKDRTTLMVPYSDLFRMMQNSLLKKNSVLISLGYSFGDEHINRIILNALSVYDFRLVIFGDSDMIRKLQEIGDNRIWIINSEDNIHYFNNFVERVLPTQDEEQREEIEIKKSLKKLAVVLGDSSEDPK